MARHLKVEIVALTTAFSSDEFRLTPHRAA
jgi:hypothetical protein